MSILALPKRGGPAAVAALAALAACLLAGAAPACARQAAAGDLADATLAISGARLTVSPESQTVPFDTPTEVLTQLAGFDAGQGTLPPNLVVMGDFSGPQVSGVLTLQTVPGQPFQIPRLQIQGQYELDNIRLMQNGNLIGYAQPRSAALTVTQVLVTSVTSRALTDDEIRSYGIVVNSSDVQAYNFTFAFAVAGQTVSYNVPVIFNGGPGEASQPVPLFQALGQSGGLQTAGPRFTPPRMAPFQLTVPAPAAAPGAAGGCMSLDGDCATQAQLPLPGVILFPTDISLLNQFFSVILMVQNGAPQGSPLVLRNLSATVSLPPGLRQASTLPPAPLGVPVPIRDPGPDGILGTADDITFLVAQASGQAQVLTEGMEQGTQVVTFNIEAVVDGLPGGRLQTVTGTAQGAVVVRDPTLNVTVAAPDVVRAQEQYQLQLTVTNTGNTPANQLTIRLPPEKLAGSQVVGASSQTVDVLPGDSALVQFTLVSLLTGRVTADAVRNASQITPTFDLTVGVGENGIPLSPNTIVLPDQVRSLPSDLEQADLLLIGLGYSLATAPPSLLTGTSLPEVTLGAVDSRVYTLTQAGVEVSMGEALFDSAAVLAAQWNGAEDQDSTWDLLRRITPKGGSAGARLGEIFAAEAAASAPRAAFDRFAATTAFVRRALGGIEGALAVGTAAAGAKLLITSRATGQRLAGGGDDAARLRELPFADLYLMDAAGAAQMALLAVPEATGYQVRLTIAGGGTADLHLLVPAADGSLRMVRWLGVTLGAAGTATVGYAPGDAAFTLAVDPQGTGAGAQQLQGSVEALAARPWGVVAAVQNAAVDPSGHVVDVLFTGDVDLTSLAPADPGHFVIPNKVSNGGLTRIDADIVTQAQQQAGPGNPAALRNSRLVRVVFNNPLSPYATPVELTVANVRSLAAETFAPVTVPVAITVTTPGEQVAGVVLGGDGQPVPFAQVTLHENDICLDCNSPCTTHASAIVQADGSGRFLFDYVRSTAECGSSFALSAIDPADSQTGSATGVVRFIGQTAQLDVEMLGRGTIRGHVAYDDGTVPAGPQVIAFSPVFRETGTTVLDAFGNYSISEVPVGTITLSASDGLGHFAITTLDVPSAGSVVGYDLVIVRVPKQPVATGEVRGSVVGPDGETPVAMAYVVLYVGGNLISVQRSDAGGDFDFGIVPAGLAEVDTYANVTGQAGDQVFFDIDPDQVNEVDLQMNAQTGAVQGHVYRQTGSTVAPVSGAVVWVDGTPFRTFTDSAGYYHLDGVFTGTWQVIAADLVNQVEVSAAATIESASDTVTRDLVFQSQLPSGIAGQVLDGSGNPVPGATVHLAAGDQQWWDETSTDVTGNFTLSGLVPGSYSVHALLGSAGGTATAVIRFAGDTPFVTIQFREGTIKGVVEAADSTGQATGVQSTLIYRTTTVREGLVGLALTPTTIETNADGTFEIDDVLAGPYTLSAYNSFYGTLTVDGTLVDQGEVQTQTLVFQKNGPGTIRGVVLDQDGVTPAVGATVHLAHPAFSAFDLQTDQNGAFEFDLVPPTPFGFPVQVTYQSGVIFRQAQVWVAFAQPNQTLTLQIVLPKQGSVAGSVQDANGNPVPSAVVTLAENHYPNRQLTVNADANAAFQFSNVFAGTASVAARAPALGGLGGKTSIEIDGEGQAVTGVLVKLQPTGRITGQVTSPVDGSAIPNAQVQLDTWTLFDSATSDADGNFEFDLLPLGGYQVQVFDPHTGRQGQSPGLTLQTNDQVLVANVVLEALGGVSGHLYDPDPTPPAGLPAATVSLTSEGITQFTTYSSTDSTGAYQFQGIPQGPFTLAAHEPQGLRNATTSGAIADEGDQITLDLFLQKEGTVTGSVFNPPGTTTGKFPNVDVTISQLGQIVGGVLASDYQFGGIVVGQRFEVDAQEIGGNHRGSATGLLAGSDPVEVDVQMVPLGSVRVVVEDAAGHPVPGANVTLYTNGFYGYHVLNASSGDDASALFQQVGAGPLGIEIYDPITLLRGFGSGALTQDGQIVELTVQLEPTGSISGTLLLADGVTPAVGAEVALQVGTRMFAIQTDGAGNFTFNAVPLGAFDLQFQQSFGPGTLEVQGVLNANGQAVELGTLTLDSTDLQVTAITPPSGSVGVPLDQVITVTFNKPLDPNRSFPGNEVLVTRSDGVTMAMNGSLSSDGASLVLAPRTPFANATTYLVTLHLPIYSATGKQLQQPLQTSFTTVDHLQPAVIEVDPPAGAVQVPLATQIHLVFNRPVALASLSGAALQLVDLTDNLGVTTTFTLSPTGRECWITPQTALLQEKKYQLTVQGLTDLVGNVQAAPLVTAFYSLDATPPRFGAISPASGASFTAGDAVAISVAASDPSGVHDVDVQLGPRGADLTAAPGGVYTATLAAPALPANTGGGGADVPITIAATDAYGNVATATVTIHVNANPDTVAPAISTCLIDGDAVAPGLALAVPFSATDNQAIASWDLVVDGQTVSTVEAAGVPPAPAVTGTVSWTPPAGSAPGTSFAMRLDAYDFAGNRGSTSFNLVVPAGTVLHGDQTLTAAVSGQALALAGGKFTVPPAGSAGSGGGGAAAVLDVASLTLMQGATLTASAGQPLAVASAGAVRVQCGAAIDAGGLGYGYGTAAHPDGFAPPGVAPAHGAFAGGSHGGQATADAAAGAAYDSVYLPQQGGGGGAAGNFPLAQGAGGGAVQVTATDLLISGQVLARGFDVCGAGAGAGGAILLQAATVHGAGQVDASGGQGQNCIDASGGGAGGRVAIYGALDGFDPASQALARGGSDTDNGPPSVWAGAGTVFYKTPAMTYGALLVDNGAGRPAVAATPLPALGAGALAALTADPADPADPADTGGVDAWATAAPPAGGFGVPWLGAWMVLLDASGNPLGGGGAGAAGAGGVPGGVGAAFQVVAIDAQGRARLAGAAAVVGAGAVSYQGQYRFDDYQPLDGTILVATDPIDVMNLTLSGPAAVTGVVVAQNLTVTSGAVVRPAAGGSLHFEVSGTMTVEAGAVIDVSGLGYAGGIPGQPAGQAPPWVSGAPQDAGGSHGGFGIGAQVAGPGGPVFDSVYLPQLGGGGGSQEGHFAGNAGGGIVVIDAGTLSLAGEIRARGVDGCLSAGSAGGSVLVRAGELDGAGTIDVSGGNAAASGCATELFDFGAGGGGRAAIHVPSINGFDPAAQVLAGAGLLTNFKTAAAPGTVLVDTAGATYGELIVDGGLAADGTPLTVPATPLPHLGTGALTGLAPAGGSAGGASTDAWASAAAAFTPEWLGAWVDLLDGGGNLLGSFQATALDASGRLLLAGAAAVPPPSADGSGSGSGSGGGAAAAAYRGGYRFDAIRLLHNGGLTAQDPVTAATLALAGANPIGGALRPVDVDVQAGAAPVPAAGGPELDLYASGTVTVEAGARLDMSGQGYAGSFGGPPAQAPPGVAAATDEAGGSHGGSGWGGGAGEVYDSVVQPALGGGGGGGAWSPPGGGVVHLEAANLVLAGQILANGGPVCNNGDGAGGTVLVKLSGTMSGGGSIGATGAATAGCGGEAGGGGRVALLAPAFSGFDPTRQVSVAGGVEYPTSPHQAAAAGTLYTLTGGQTYGTLRVDAGAPAGANPVLATVLPSIGRGVIGSVTPAAGDPASVWITAQAGTPLWSLGAAGMWVRLGGSDYLVTGQSADRTQILLQGAAAAAAVGESFVGVYHFDEVTVTGDANLVVGDAAAFGATEVDPGSTLQTLDLVPPVISNVQPAAGAVYTAGQPVAISATVTDDHLATVAISLGERSVTLTAPPFAWTVPAPPVAAAGDVTLTVVATDQAGNAATVTQPVHVLPATAAGPPAVAIACPTTGALLAPGTSLGLAATAGEASGIAKVEVFLGTSTTRAAVAYAPPYSFVFTAPAGDADGQVEHVRVRATSYGDTTAEAAADFTVVAGHVLTAGTEIAAGNTAYDGASLIVAGGTATIDGPHAFRDLVVLDGATVKHSPTTASQENHLVVTLARNLYVACGGAIDVSNLGYLGADGIAHAYGYGNTTAEGAAPNGGGGSYGGRGGRYDGSSPVYGSFWNPQDPGAGGGWEAGTTFGTTNGGGVVDINAAGAGLIDGAVRANGGQQPLGGAGGGAGGSVLLNAASLAGAGTIQALGGPPTAWPNPASTGGGSGGRIALYGATIDPGLLSRVSAAGAAGASTDPSTWGAAGTVFTKLDGNPYGDLTIDNAGVASSQLTELLSVGSGVVTAVGASGFTDSLADFHHDLSGIDVLFNGNAASLFPVTANAHHGQTLTLQVPAPPLSSAVAAGATYSGLYRFGNVVVRGGARAIAVDPVSSTDPPQVASGSSWTPAYAGTIQITSPAAGSTLSAGSAMTVTTSVSDLLGIRQVVFSLAGQSFTAGAPPYSWATNAPPVAAATAYTLTAVAFTAGGSYLTASIPLTVEPAVDPLAPVVSLPCTQDGDLVLAGVAVPVVFNVADALQVSSYSLIVNGAVVQTVTSNQAKVSASLSWTPPAGTAAGTSFDVKVTATNAGGHVGFAEFHLVAASQTPLTGTLTLGSTYAGQSLLLGAGTFTVPGPLSLAALRLLNGATVTGVAGQPIALTVAGALTVQCGGAIDAGALGYAGGKPGTAAAVPAGVTAPAANAGGSHGGTSFVFGGRGGPVGGVFDSVYMPQQGGGGGSQLANCCATRGGNGGGVIGLTVGALQVNGQIRARGEVRPANDPEPAGAGGAVLVAATGAIGGAGTIDVSGGAAGGSDAPGGGGRVALYAASFQGFDPTAQVVVQGGALTQATAPPYGYAGPGTVFWKDGTGTYGRLLLASGKDASGNDQVGPATPLPALGGGAVASWTAAGANALLAAASAFQQPWLGAWVAVSGAAGNLLGEFQVVQIDGQGRLLLAGAGAVAGAAAYQGEYRFDRIDLQSSAGLAASDPVKTGDFEVWGAAARMPGQLVASTMTVNSGAVVTPVGGVLQASVSGLVTIQAGARLDVSAAGYAGAATNRGSGQAPPGATAAGVDAGGSHGGVSFVYNSGYPGPAGSAYDSVYQPLQAGGGGSLVSITTTGVHAGAGGGIVNLSAGSLQLDGTISARGETRTTSAGNTDAGGAGGSVLLQVAGSFAGAGTVDVSGGLYNASGGNYAAPGAGGRVALYAASFAGFDPTAQVKVQGGQLIPNSALAAPYKYAGPGTVFWKDGAATYGRLLIDGGKDANGNDQVGPATPLPALGGGAVSGWTAAGGNAWLAAAAPFQQPWLGAWVALSDAGGNALGEFAVVQIDGQGRLLLAGAGAVSGAAAYQGEYRFDRIDLQSSAGLAASDPVKVGDLEVSGASARLPSQFTAASMTVHAGAVVTPAGGTLRATVSGALDVQAGARIDASAGGYPGATTSHGSGQAPAGVAGTAYDAGGAHGGVSFLYGPYAGPAGGVFDSVYEPQQGGGGGSLINAGTGVHGGNGGGLIDLTVGSLQLDGSLVAKGETRERPGNYDPSGAGGSVIVRVAGTMSGAGAIDVSGGLYDATNAYGAPGAGGRVALYAGSFAGFDPTAQVTMQGGQLADASPAGAYGYAGPGTLYYKDGAATYGRLRIDSGRDANGNPQQGPVTPLPALGGGAVSAWTPNGNDAWLAAPAAFQQPWLGAWVSLADGAGDALGEFEVSQIDAQGRLLLAGAGAVVGAATWHGEYRFDRVDLANSAGLSASDPIKTGDLELDSGTPRLASVGQIATTNLTVQAGAVLSTAPGVALQLAVPGTLDVQSGGRIDVTAMGIAGTTVAGPGTAPPGVTPLPQWDAGGCHGGLGNTYHGGTVGVVFDSVYAPQLGGGGGSLDTTFSTYHGGAGGGVVELTCGTLQLDGQIVARGETRTGDSGASGGGGTVLVTAATLAGAGSIDASGGTGNGTYEGGGPGGGGRVALYAATFQGFNPASQVTAAGGGEVKSNQTVNDWGGPGTVFWKSGGATYGRLDVDSGLGTAFGGTLPVTQLPRIGAGTVGTVTADAAVPANRWITASGGAAFQLGAVGMWVRDNGVDYPVLAQSADLKSLELGGAGAVTAGDSFRGVYKFDEVDVHGGAKLQFNDTNVVGTWTVDPNSSVIQNAP